MCKASKPTITKAPELARRAEPDNAALYEEASNRASQRGGGKRRSTVLTGLQSLGTMPMLGAQVGRPGPTVLG